MSTLVEHALSSVIVGTPVIHANITMVPLLGLPSVEQEPGYLTLDEALKAGVTEITEVSEQGSVPNLRVINKGVKPVFILDGEELLGAKQNRIVNLSILVPAKASLTIPVSCVEAGRWRSRSRAFSSAPRMHFSTGRAKRMMRVTANLKMSGSRHSDQAEVWSDIAAMSSRLDAHSPTAAMEEIFHKHASFTDSAAETLRPSPRQSGALFLLDGRVVGFDLFDRAPTLRRLLPKLVRSVAVDALARPESEPPITKDLSIKVAEHFLANVCAAATHEAPAVGVGRDVRLEAPILAGSALAVDDAFVHISAFHI
jgi:hypothetical protein